jgi:hypothetical protein
MKILPIKSPTETFKEKKLPIQPGRAQNKVQALLSALQ